MQLSQFDYLRRAVEALFSGAALALQAQHDGRGHWGDMEEVEGDDREYGSTLLVYHIQYVIYMHDKGNWFRIQDVMIWWHDYEWCLLHHKFLWCMLLSGN